MRIKEGFVLRKLKDKYIVVGEGLAQVNFNHIITLNESAAYLWKNVEGKDFTVEDLTRLLLARYNVSEDLARADATRLAAEMVDKGVATL